MKYIICIISLILTIWVFDTYMDKVNVIESPLVTVIKLKSAEQLLDKEEIQKYMKISDVFDSKQTNSKKAFNDYFKFLEFLKKNKKYTNEFFYNQYSIQETINNETAKVVFIENETKDELIYLLKLIQNNWIVVKINVKNEMNGDSK